MSEAKAHKHPDEMAYVKVAIFLAIITAAEVAVFYVPPLKAMARPVLSVMMVVKFAMVAMWFMHLRFDSPIFRRFFVLGIVLAVLVFGVVLWTFTFTVPDSGTPGSDTTTDAAGSPGAAGSDTTAFAAAFAAPAGPDRAYPAGSAAA